jgi:hypothetical protein
MLCEGLALEDAAAKTQLCRNSSTRYSGMNRRTFLVPAMNSLFDNERSLQMNKETACQIQYEFVYTSSMETDVSIALFTLSPAMTSYPGKG